MKPTLDKIERLLCIASDAGKAEAAGKTATAERLDMELKRGVEAIEQALTKASLNADRLAWLHSPASNNVDGWEWGIFRVRWLNDGRGNVAEVLQTGSDFSDLDAAMRASFPPCPACHGKGYTDEGDPEIGSAVFDCVRCEGAGTDGSDAMNLQQRAIDLHEKAGMPWTQADALALSEAGITDADIDEMIGEHSDTVLVGFVPRDDVRAFVRGILVHNAHRVARGEPEAAAPAEPTMWERQLRAIVRHWNEFGPSHGFGEQMDCADTAVRAADGGKAEEVQADGLHPTERRSTSPDGAALDLQNDHTPGGKTCVMCVGIDLPTGVPCARCGRTAGVEVRDGR